MANRSLLLCQPCYVRRSSEKKPKTWVSEKKGPGFTSPINVGQVNAQTKKQGLLCWCSFEDFFLCHRPSSSWYLNAIPRSFNTAYLTIVPSWVPPLPAWAALSSVNRVPCLSWLLLFWSLSSTIELILSGTHFFCVKSIEDLVPIPQNDRFARIEVLPVTYLAQELLLVIR